MVFSGSAAESRSSSKDGLRPTHICHPVVLQKETRLRACTSSGPSKGALRSNESQAPADLVVTEHPTSSPSWASKSAYR